MTIDIDERALDTTWTVIEAYWQFQDRPPERQRAAMQVVIAAALRQVAAEAAETCVRQHHSGADTLATMLCADAIRDRFGIKAEVDE